MRTAAVSLLLAAFLSVLSTRPTLAAASSPPTCKELRSAHAKAKTTKGGLMERRRAARAIRAAGCR